MEKLYTLTLSPKNKQAINPDEEAARYTSAAFDAVRASAGSVRPTFPLTFFLFQHCWPRSLLANASLSPRFC